MDMKLTDRSATMKAQEQASWGRLEPVHSGSQTFYLNKQETSIGRLPSNDLAILNPKISGTHCRVIYKNGQVKVTDNSGNGTFVNAKLIGKGNIGQPVHNDVLWILHQSKVESHQVVGFKLLLTSVIEQQKKQAERIQAKKKAEKEEAEKKAGAAYKEQENKQKKAFDNLANKLKEQISCAMCLEIIYLPVTVHPCNHHFCGACVSGWVKKSQDCPQCRKPLLTARRDAAWNQLIEDYLKSHPDEEKSDDVKKEQVATNIFNFDTYYFKNPQPEKKVQEKKEIPRQPRGRGRIARRDSDLSAGSVSPAKGKCPECKQPRNGFMCQPDGKHLNCDCCAASFADRGDNLAFPQNCAICQKSFCNLYTGKCKGRGVQMHLVRNRHIKKPIPYDVGLLRGNATEFQLYGKLMRDTRLNQQELFKHMVQWMDNNVFMFIVDKKINLNKNLKVAKEIRINSRTPVCENCWRELWFQMVFTWMIQNKHRLPLAMAGRPDCYWGINCSTMRRPDHAAKLNHVCYQTRFT